MPRSRSKGSKASQLPSDVAPPTPKMTKFLLGVRTAAVRYLEVRAEYAAAPRLLAALYRGPSFRWTGAVIAFIVGALLLLHPLTSMLVGFVVLTLFAVWRGSSLAFGLTGGAGLAGNAGPGRNAGPASGAGKPDAQTPAKAPALVRGLSGFVVAGGLLLLAQVPGSVAWLPYVGCALLALSGLARLLTLGRSVTRAILRGSYAVFCLLVSLTGLFWPDIVLMVMGYVFAVWLLRIAFTLLLRAPRDRTSGGEIVAASYDLAPSGTISRGGAAGTSARGGVAGFLRQDTMNSRIIASALAVVLVLGGSVVAGASGLLRSTAPDMDFYALPEFTATPTSDPAGDPAKPAPGTLLRIGRYNGDTPEGLTVKRILFSTTDTAGQFTVASGLIAVPSNIVENQNVPLISWNHGTNGLEPACAPSAGPHALTEDAVPALADIVANGWAVVAPDFMSHATPRLTPYLIGEGEARYSLDAIRAARTITLADLKSADKIIDDPHTGPDLFSKQTVVWGHSQGGHAALWTSQFAGQYAPELDIAGTAALSPAALPLELGEDLTGKSASGAVSVIISYVVGSYAAAYSDVKEAELVRFGGQPIVDALSSRCTNASSLASLVTLIGLGKEASGLFPSIESDSPLGVRLKENNVTGPFPGPVFVGWGAKDEVISSDMQDSFVQAMCTAGVNLTAIEYPDRTHLDVLAPDSPMPADLAAWTADRFAGVAPAASSCG